MNVACEKNSARAWRRKRNREKKQPSAICSVPTWLKETLFAARSQNGGTGSDHAQVTSGSGIIGMGRRAV